MGGDEFCKGCRDCTGGDPTEDDFSKNANIPIAHLNDAFLNGNSGNITNNNSLMGGPPNLSTANSKYPDDLYTPKKDLLKGGKLRQVYDGINNNEYENPDNNNYDPELFKENLEDIKKRYQLALIVRAMRALKRLKKKSHDKIIKEYCDDYLKKIEDTDIDLIPEKSYIYIGTKFNNQKDGLGMEIFSSCNAKYFGRYRYNKRVEYGRFVIKNENVSYNFNGEVRSIYASGFGIMDNKLLQSKYMGDWETSCKNGYGIEHYKDKSVYKGLFFRGRKHGLGTYKWTDGSSYEGEWDNNTLKGYGIYKFADGSIYKGQWNENRMNGLGEFTFPNEKTYIGFFQGDCRNGFGILVWYKEEKAFIGFWSGNKQNGIGKFLADGKIRYGYWEDGQLSRKIRDKEIFFSKLTYEERVFMPYFQIDEYNQVLGCVKRVLQKC